MNQKLEGFPATKNTLVGTQLFVTVPVILTTNLFTTLELQRVKVKIRSTYVCRVALCDTIYVERVLEE